MGNEFIYSVMITHIEENWSYFNFREMLSCDVAL